MSMIGFYLRVTNDELNSYLKDSIKLETRLDESTGEDPNMIDVDKSWEGLFFLLTGKPLAAFEEAPTPLAWILNANQTIDEEELDMGYGPASYSTVEETKEIAIALNAITEEELRKRFNGKLMLELGVYPEIWDEEESIDYLIDNFYPLQDFYNKAAADNHAVITYLS